MNTFTVRHVVPGGRRSSRTLRAGAIALGVFIVITIVAVVSFAGRGSQASMIRTVQKNLCVALGKALDGKLTIKDSYAGYDVKTNEANCTYIDAHSDAVTLYQFVGMNGKPNYLANVKTDQTKPGFGWFPVLVVASWEYLGATCFG